MAGPVRLMQLLIAVIMAATALLAAACGENSNTVATSSPAGTTEAANLVTATPAESGTAGPEVPPAGCLLGPLPDPACTPGATDPRVTQDNIQQTICRSGYTRTVRPPVSVTDRIKRERLAAYGLGGQSTRDYELDHLIPLELGGAPETVANLWPEPWNGADGARKKDEVENAAHRAVCAGRMTLAEAQARVAANWIDLGLSLGVR